jgi:hypothetical protein
MAVRTPSGDLPAVTRMFLVPALVLQGEVWRLVTFLFIPPLTINPVFVFFGFYFLYLMGTALESYWGSFRFNVYLLIGWLATVAVSFVTPMEPASNAYLLGSIFLAFAFLYPDYQILLFFVLPVKVKWIALLTWVMYAYKLIAGPWSSRLEVVAAVLNFGVFFGHTVYLRVKYGARKAGARAKKAVVAEAPFHVCAKCGVTDKTNPKMEFRYCPECDGTPGYCIDHINDHEHIKKVG